MFDVPWYDETDIIEFPPVNQALSHPDGLLAFGGNLSSVTLMNAYQNGIFPWFDDEQPIMWWSPSIRAVIPTEAIHISKNMAKLLRQNRYRVAADTNFSAVIAACSQREATWITPEMQAAYFRLHQKGVAHSIEVYDEADVLVGGLYGVFVRNCFCGESMFSHQANVSKLALIFLAQFLLSCNCYLIDCQLPTAHLRRMGAIDKGREHFVEQLQKMPDNIQLTTNSWVQLWQQS